MQIVEPRNLVDRSGLVSKKGNKLFEETMVEFQTSRFPTSDLNKHDHIAWRRSLSMQFRLG